MNQLLLSSSVGHQFSRSVVSDSLRPHESQHTRPPCPSRTPRVYSIESVMPSNRLILCCLLLLPPSIFPSISIFSSESVLCIKWPKYWSFSFSISPSSKYSGLISLRFDWFDLAVSRVFSTPQFEGTNSLAFNLFYCPTFTSIHDYWKNHSFDYTDLCRQSNVSAF